MLTTIIKNRPRLIDAAAITILFGLCLSIQASTFILKEYLVQQDDNFFYIRYEFPNYTAAAQWNLYTIEGIYISPLASVATTANTNSNELLVLHSEDEFSFFHIISSSASSTLEDAFYLVELGMIWLMNKYMKLFRNTIPSTCRFNALHPNRHIDYFK